MVKGNTCAVEGCINVLTKTSGRICQMHRTRMYRHGTYDLPQNHFRDKYHKPCITQFGYVRININGKRVLEHRYVMEQHLGRTLTEKERIHHINGDKTDNRIENLKLYADNAEHMSENHPNCWKNKKTNGELTPEIIHQIIDRIYLDGGAFSICFCGRDVECRNLCGKHYQWAYSRKLFSPNKRQNHYDGIHHMANI